MIFHANIGIDPGKSEPVCNELLSAVFLYYVTRKNYVKVQLCMLMCTKTTSARERHTEKSEGRTSTKHIPLSVYSKNRANIDYVR